MLKANYLLKNSKNRQQSLTVEETGWRGDPDKQEKRRECSHWRRRSAKAIRTHLQENKSKLEINHATVKLALEEAMELMNERAGALKALEKKERNKEIRKASKESNDKAQMKRDREVAKNERLKMEARERDLRSSDSGSDGSDGSIHSSDDMDDSEEEKAPPPRAAAHRTARAAAPPAAPPRAAPPPVVEPERRHKRRNDAPYTREQQAHLDAWKTREWNFNEWCYKEKYGELMLENLIATRGADAVPPTEPPARWEAAQQPVEEKKTPHPVEPPAAVNPQAEMALRQALAQHDIEDIRTPVRIPIPRSVAPRAAMMEREATPPSGSDSDLSVTPAVGSMHVE